MARTIMQSRLAFEFIRLLLLTFCILMLTQRPSYGITLAIDFDGGGGPTQSGFVGFPVEAEGSVITDGVTFTLDQLYLSSDLGGPDDLLRDFVYTEGDENTTVVISVSGLMPGLWVLDIWSSFGIENEPVIRSFTTQTLTLPRDFNLIIGEAGVVDLSLPLPPPDLSLPLPPPPPPPAVGGGSACDSAIMTCPGGFVINKDPNNGCAFCPCPPPGTTPEPCGAIVATGLPLAASSPLATGLYQMRLEALMLTSVALDPPEPNPAPEPPTLVLVALGLAMARFVFVRRRRT